MKKLLIILTLGTFGFFAAHTACAQPGTAEEQVKSLSQTFSEGDVFYNVDTDENYKAAAFSSSDADGTVKCWRWYYRPVYRTYTWRPTYYRPYYTYYRYYVRPYRVHFTWTTISVYKSGDNQGAMLDSDPEQGSPLAAKGLRKGDIITAVDGQPLKDLAALNRATANSQLSVHKGSTVKFAGNLLKNADEDFMKKFDGLQEVEAGTLLTKAEIKSGDYDMYKFYDRNNAPVFGVKAVKNNGNGVKVTEVVANLPGQKSGFEVNDVILEINGVKIASEQDYSDAIDCAGKVARMKVLCGKTNQTVDADVILNK
ncbi:MAG: PDZ domain-containing protein [Planctomycetaceae bacterium]|jgi:membrane-associated protease RseP (regulator of RpoE activity)|nr:PDZ domain-containing protein [Planctomycetaceae bacterium]